MKKYVPGRELIGGFDCGDGTIDFYLRIGSLLTYNSKVVDLGAGRAGWYEDDVCEVRRSVRYLRAEGRTIIAADVDEAVLDNKACDKRVVFQPGMSLDIDPGSVDLVIADFVLEHIDDAGSFFSQVDSCLKSGGWFCARTPYKFSYVAVFARLIENGLHQRVLSWIQPDRKIQDIFPTSYKLNTNSDIERVFRGWENNTFMFRAQPAYFFGSKKMYNAQSFVHRLLPCWLSGNLFIFLRKP